MRSISFTHFSPDSVFQIDSTLRNFEDERVRTPQGTREEINPSLHATWKGVA